MEEFNHIPAILAAFPKVSAQIIRKGAFDVLAAMQQHTPVATGNLRNSEYVVTDEQSTYPGSADKDLLPPLDEEANATTAWVAVAAAYGIDVNFGTAHMAAQPFVEPSVDEVRPAFENAWHDLELKLAEVGGI